MTGSATIGTVSSIYDTFKSLTRVFINTYSAANPKSSRPTFLIERAIVKAMLLHAKDMIFRPSSRKRVIFFLFLDIPAVALSLYLAFVVYFELSRNIRYSALTREVLPYFLFVKLFSFSVARV